MYKKIVGLLFIATIFLFSCKSSQQEAVVNGNVKDLGISELFFIKIDGKQKIDTVKVTDGKFTYKNILTEPTVFMINIGAEASPIFAVLESGSYQFSVSNDGSKSIHITGGKEQEIYNSFLKESKPLFSKMDSLAMYANANQLSEQELQTVQAEFLKTNSTLEKMESDFIEKNKNTVAAAFIANNLISGNPDKNYELVQKYYNMLSPEVQKTYLGTQLSAMANALKSTSIGQLAQNFTLNDVNGKPVSLNDYKGKITLIDFWASWCGPCRNENPNVVAAYNQFHAKGFEILGVSLDDNKEKWMDAIEKDQLKWAHVSDLKGWESEVAKMYGIESIPSNFLLDAEGKIIAKNLRGEELANKLAEVLK